MSCPATCSARRPRPACSVSASPSRSAATAATPSTSVIICEELHEAGTPGGVFASLFTCGIAVPHMIASGDERLIETFVRPTLRGELIGSLAITEPGGGSDVGHLRTTAVRDGDHYVVNGAKTYITSGGARPTTSSPPCAPAGPGAAGVSLLVVEKGTPGFEVSRKLDKMGWRSSDTAELSYTDVRVPVEPTWSARRTPASCRSPRPSSPNASALPCRHIRVRSAAWT